MNIRNELRTRYLSRAILWAILAIATAIPAMYYLHDYAQHVREGLSWVK